MRRTAKALKTFVSNFGLPCYTNSSVPDDVALPYIVYPLTEPEWDTKASFYMILWAHVTDYETLLTIADGILHSIGRGVKIDLPAETGATPGYLVIWPETPAIQEVHDKEHDLKGIYFNLSMNVYNLPGA